MKKTIVFDLGGVLLDWDPRYLYRNVFQDKQEMEYFLSEICSPAWNARMDAELTFQQGITELLSLYPEYEEQIQLYHTNWSEMLGGELPASVAILRELMEAGLNLAGLSNWPLEKFLMIKDQYEFLEWLNPLVISGRVGVAKPDPAIYHFLLKELGVSAEDCIFIDDMFDNIKQADRLGFETIHFVSAENLRLELVGRGLLDEILH